MEVWLTVVIIPIFIAIFVNILTASDKVTLPSNENKIMSYKELLDMHVKQLKNENISRLEISRRCNQIVEITNTMYELYLQNCKYESSMVKDLFNIQNQCILMIESKKSNISYISAVVELGKYISKFYNTMTNNYKKYYKSESIGTRGSAIVLLLLIIIGTVSGVWCTYKGLLENDYITFAAIVCVVLLYWIIIINIINLTGYLKKRLKGK